MHDSIPAGTALATLAARQGDSSDVWAARVRRGRRVDKLRNRPRGHGSSSWRVYRPSSQGREAGRPAGFAVDQIRAGHQPANRKASRHRGAGWAAQNRYEPAPEIGMAKQKNRNCYLGAIGLPVRHVVDSACFKIRWSISLLRHTLARRGSK